MRMVVRSDVVIFHLAKHWSMIGDQATHQSLYEQIRSGWKTSEWREFSNYWVHRLFDWKVMDRKVTFYEKQTEPIDLTNFSKVHKAWFVEGYPKGNLPRLEAEITGLIYFPATSQLEIKFDEVREIASSDSDLETKLHDLWTLSQWKCLKEYLARKKSNTTRRNVRFKGG